MKKARAAAPYDRDVLLYHARSAILLQRFDRAEQSLRSLIAANDGDADAHFYLAYTFYLESRYREALIEFDRAENEGSAIETIPYFQGGVPVPLGRVRKGAGGARGGRRKASRNLSRQPLLSRGDLFSSRRV
ncbi:MAG: hypothetical protein M5R36_22315 [Deltaproteobacteria bacterium]|nr:hypothetical protein [Deltaproteobacteria bacterium]